MITAGKVSETLVLDGIKWGMGILLVLFCGFHTRVPFLITTNKNKKINQQYKA